MYWKLMVELPEEQVDTLQGVLGLAQAESEEDEAPQGVEVRESSLKPLPGALPLEAGRAAVIAWFASETGARQFEQRLPEYLSDYTCALLAEEEQDWSVAWREKVEATRVGSIWVGPPWLTETELCASAAIRLVIEPGMAFGTGDHPTTALCLGGLERALTERPGASVLDIGTGSGVLAIAARKLGAGRVAGNDIDPAAVRIAGENAELNGAPDLELSGLPLERLSGQFSIVVANLFSNVLCQLAPKMVARCAPGALLLLSGVLDTQGEEVLEAFRAEGCTALQGEARGEWLLLRLVAPGDSGGEARAP